MIFSASSKQFFRTDAGFTLVEVMVSLTIMGMIIAVAFSGLSVGLRNWDRGGRKIDDLEARAKVERLLSRQLAVASPMLFSINDQMVPLFRGTSSRLEFISDYSGASGSVGFRKIDYADERGRFLYGEKQITGYVPAADEPSPAETVATFQSVRFRFLKAGKEGDFSWIDEWKPEMGLPAAVEAGLGDHSLLVRLVNR